ncbi:MAG: hypothetical protein K0R15_157 [Clostridiales bacterium]|nr:hypothetical protein [Clostridiales bacterium]
MKRMKKVVAIALALLMVIGTLPNNLAMLNVNAETTALTIDGSFADWTMQMNMLI